MSATPYGPLIDPIQPVMIFPNCLSRFIVWSNHATVKQAVAD